MNWNYENGRIYGTDDAGLLMCEATYVRLDNGEMDIDHTYVDPSLRGQGVAGKLMEVVADFFRKQGYKTMASCSYAHIWLKRHKNYEDILSEKLTEQGLACKIDGKH